MAKRFTDTEKWKKAWFRKLGPEGRDLWYYVHDQCDESGLLEIDLDRFAADLGHPVTLADLRKVLRDEFVEISEEKFFLRAFVEFQYGKLRESSPPHRKVIEKLQRRGIDPKTLRVSDRVLDTLSSRVQEEEEAEAEAEEEEKAEEAQPEIVAAEPQGVVTRAMVDQAASVWLQTLADLGAARDGGLTPHEQAEIFRALRQYGVEYTEKILFGARFEKGSENWNPADYVSISRVLFGKNKQGLPLHDRLVNLADQHRKPKWRSSTDAV